MFSPFSEFIIDGTCLLADPSIAFLSNIKSNLINLGVPGNRIILATKFEEALKVVQQHDIKLLITEYAFKGSPGNGLSLVDALKKKKDTSDFISMMITNDSTDAIVAEAAEGQIDSFLVKPFSGAAFEEKLNLAADQKVNPSRYMLQINEGKKLIANRNYEQARKIFEEAKKLSEKPALACFYVGWTAQIENDLQRALNEFREGRSYTPLHYLCLFGEFEILVNNKRFREADELITIIKKHYPITAYRLGQIMIAVLFAGNFASLKECYSLLLKIDNRPKQLTNIAVDAFVAAGRHFLKLKNKSEAFEYFDMAVMAAGRDMDVLEKIMKELINVKAYHEAEEYLMKASKHDIGSSRYAQLQLMVSEHLLSPEEFIQKGRKLVADGQGTPAIYTNLVKAMVNTGKITLAESLIQRAVTEYPEMHGQLYSLLNDHTELKKSA